MLTRKVFTILLVAVIMAFGSIIPAFADDIRVPINFAVMSDEELLVLATTISEEMLNRGLSMPTSEKAPSETANEPTSENDNDEKADSSESSNEPDTLFEGATELSDESFLQDLAAGLSARWVLADTDSSLMSDKQLKEHYTRLVNCELVYVTKYSEYQFEDEKLGEYAHNYVNALQSQFIAITEYFGVDEKAYNEYWSSGYATRARYIYLINKGYGITMESKFNEDLKGMVELGAFYNIQMPIEAALRTELTSLELDMTKEGSSKYVYVQPLNINNTSPNDISGLTVKINFINDKDVIVDTGYLLSYENVSAGKAISTQKASTDDNFSRISFTYSYSVNTGSYADNFEGTVEPEIQFSYDGKIKKNGELASGQPELQIGNMIKGWEMNSSWSKTLYVPTLKFDVKNTGTGDAERVTVRCVFTNNETKEVWDEETAYVVGSSDIPLKAGYSKKAFIYSSVGYRSKITSTPKLTVDIYINDQLVDTITID